MSCCKDRDHTFPFCVYLACSSPSVSAHKAVNSSFQCAKTGLLTNLVLLEHCVYQSWSDLAEMQILMPRLWGLRTYIPEALR